MEWPPEFWEHQRRGCEATVNAFSAGKRRLVVTGPCGSGKSKMMAALTEYGVNQWWNTILYTNRRLLLSQTSGVLSKHGIDHGFRASGYKPALLRSVQLAMVQSEGTAVLKRKSRELHNAQLAIPDEIHALGGDTMPTLLKMHYEQGANIAAFSATPIDLTGEWDDIIVACTTSEGRKCGALVPAITYCPDEPDMKHVKSYRIGEDLTDKENAKLMMRPGIFGRVYQHFSILNPTVRPTILFAPDVAGSVFFAEEFTKKGVRAAHIDAKEIWYDGRVMPSDDENREWLLRAFESGEIQLLSNRFILREAIDLPFVAHAIFACKVGSLKSWLQMGGRAIRAHPDTPTVCIQDHGANYRTHGSLNADRIWRLGMSGVKETGMRQDAMRESPETEPIRCPKCGAMRLSGPKCPICGHVSTKRSRLVVQIDGKLKLAEGPTFKPHYTKMMPDTEKKWRSMIYRAKSPKWDATFNQAAALFVHENGYWPPKNLPLMPQSPSDWYEKVNNVPVDRLQ